MVSRIRAQGIFSVPCFSYLGVITRRPALHAHLAQQPFCLISAMLKSGSERGFSMEVAARPMNRFTTPWWCPGIAYWFTACLGSGSAGLSKSNSSSSASYGARALHPVRRLLQSHSPRPASAPLWHILSLQTKKTAKSFPCGVGSLSVGVPHDAHLCGPGEEGC